MNLIKAIVLGVAAAALAVAVLAPAAFLMDGNTTVSDFIIGVLYFGAVVGTIVWITTGYETSDFSVTISDVLLIVALLGTINGATWATSREPKCHETFDIRTGKDRFHINSIVMCDDGTVREEHDPTR